MKIIDIFATFSTFARKKIYFLSLVRTPFFFFFLFAPYLITYSRKV